ncbi:hypothetical protein CRM22_008774 [Opisthorchis felineus]|uniref:Uncharacterized protein n=1 Tax=Opisthorchis felineus TaxID=147828 RepID=A0A4S2LHT5_OPIFE|nr:hypothetical protein CRM22_008774 [Opisthorchis felineus]
MYPYTWVPQQYLSSQPTALSRPMTRKTFESIRDTVYWSASRYSEQRALQPPHFLFCHVTPDAPKASSTSLLAERLGGDPQADYFSFRTLANFQLPSCFCSSALKFLCICVRCSTFYPPPKHVCSLRFLSSVIYCLVLLSNILRDGNGFVTNR